MWNLGAGALVLNSAANLLAQSSNGGPEAAGALCFLAFFGIILLLSFALVAFQIWMLIDCIIYESKMPEHDNQLVLWLILILLTGWISGAVYYFVRRPNNRYGVK